MWLVTAVLAALVRRAAASVLVRHDEIEGLDALELGDVPVSRRHGDAFDALIEPAGVDVAVAVGVAGAPEGSALDLGGQQQCWEHALFLNAANSLERPGVEALQEIMHNTKLRQNYKLRIAVERSSREAGSKKHARTGADTPDGYSNDPIPGIGFQPGRAIYAVLDKSGTRLNEVACAVGGASSDCGHPWPLLTAENVANFVQWALPATPCYTFLEFWGHGMGPIGYGESVSPPEDHVYAMPLQDVVVALDQSLGSAKVDILGFDSCFMGSYEVVNRLGRFANLLLVSEATEPEHGWDYRVMDPAHPPALMVQTLTEGFLKKSEYRPKTLAAVDTQVFFAHLQPAMTRLCVLLLTRLRKGESAAEGVLAKVRGDVVTFETSADEVGAPHSGIDLGSFLVELLKRLPESWAAELKAAQAAQDAYGKVFAHNGNFARNVQAYTGLSLFFPEVKETVVKRLRTYRKSVGAIGVWGELVEAYTAFKPAEPSEEGGSEPACQAPLSVSAEKLQVQANTVQWHGDAACSVQHATIYYGAMDGGQVVVHGRQQGHLWPEGRWRATLPGFAATLAVGDGMPVVVFADEPEVFDIPVEYFPQKCGKRGVRGVLRGTSRLFQLLTTGENGLLEEQPGVRGALRPLKLSMTPGKVTESPELESSVGVDCVLRKDAQKAQLTFSKEPQDFVGVFLLKSVEELVAQIIRCDAEKCVSGGVLAALALAVLW